MDLNLQGCKYVNKKNTHVLLNYGCAGKKIASQFVENRDAIFWKKKYISLYIKTQRRSFCSCISAIKYKNKYWFLIMEVVNFKYNWFWIDSLGMYDTMTTMPTNQEV